MGMYNELNKISQSIVSSKKAKQQIKEQQEFEKDLQKELLQIMQEKLIIEAENNNIFEDETKERIIIETIEEYLQSTRSPAWRTRFNSKYRKKLELFLNQNYFTIAGKAERIEKKQNVNKDDYKKQIAIEKWHMQKQLMQQKVNEKSQKEAELLLIAKEQNRQALRDLISTIFDVGFKILVVMVKITFYIVLIPVKLGLAFLGGFIGGMIKIK